MRTQKGTDRTSLYFIGDTGLGPRLFSETHPTSSALDALQKSIAGSSFDPDYRSPWPDGTTVLGVNRRGTVDDVFLSAEVDLRSRPGSLGADEARMAVQQAVLTVGAAGADERPVVFFVDGTRADRLLGVDVSTPVRAGSPDDVLAPVSISSPPDISDEDMATHSSPLRVTGRAAAFEGTVLWELRQGDTVVKRGFTTAKQCCTLSPYSFTVSAPPGDYTLVVHDQDVSDGEGVPVSADTKRITIE